MPSGLSASAPPDGDAVITSAEELAGVGVTYLAVGLAGETVAAQIDAIDSFGSTVLPALDRL